MTQIDTKALQEHMSQLNECLDNYFYILSDLCIQFNKANKTTQATVENIFSNDLLVKLLYQEKANSLLAKMRNMGEDLNRLVRETDCLSDNILDDLDELECKYENEENNEE